MIVTLICISLNVQTPLTDDNVCDQQIEDFLDSDINSLDDSIPSGADDYCLSAH